MVGKNITVIKIPISGPRVDKPISFDRLGELMLHQLENPIKVKTGAPTSIAVRRPPKKRSKTKKHKRSKHHARHEESKQEPPKVSIEDDLKLLREKFNKKIDTGTSEDANNEPNVNAPIIEFESDDDNKHNLKEDDEGNDEDSDDEGNDEDSDDEGNDEDSDDEGNDEDSGEESEEGSYEEEDIEMTPEEEMREHLRQMRIWKKKYPRKAFPEYNEHSSLASVRQYVEDFGEEEKINKSISFYRSGLMMMFAASDKILVDKIGIKEMQGFGRAQIVEMEETYDPLIVDIAAESTMMGWFDELAPDMKLIIVILMQGFGYYLFGKVTTSKPEQPQQPTKKMSGPSIDFDDL